MAETRQFIKEPGRSKRMRFTAFQYIVLKPPTERLALWLISEAPHAFNPLYFGQFVVKQPELSKPDSALSKWLIIVEQLRDDKYIQQLPDFNYSLTFDGKLRKFALNVRFEYVRLILAPLVAIGLFTCGYFTGRNNLPKNQEQTPPNTTTNSAKKGDSLIDSLPKVDTQPTLKRDTTIK